MKNDLHIRTNISASANKDCTWENVLQKCQKLGLERISITDFDTCLFHIINKIVDTKRYFDGQIITGMECDVCEDGITLELLAYNFEPIQTLKWSYETYGTLEMRQTKIKNLLVDCIKNVDLKFDTSKIFNGKVDFAHKFVYENLLLFKENKTFFDKYNIDDLTDFYNLSTKERDFPLYVSMEKVFPNIKEVVDYIHSVGGFVSLAQPCKSKNKDNLDKLLGYVTKYKIDAIEVYHPTHSKEDIASLLSFCKEHNLVVTGGSNFNGKSETNKLGINNIDDEQKEILRGISI